MHQLRNCDRLGYMVQSGPETLTRLGIRPPMPSRCMKSTSRAGKGAGTPEEESFSKAGALRILLISTGLFSAALFWVRDGVVQETGTNLRNELAVLASQHSFTISGINNLEDEAANLGSEGSLDERLKFLLSGYN